MGKFVLKKTANGKVMFNLLAGNSQIICTSQMYASEATAKNGSESVRKNVGSDIEDQTVEGFETKKCPKWELYTDKAGETRFRLKASNGEIIASGEGYKAKSSALNGIESIRKNAPDAEIVKDYE